MSRVGVAQGPTDQTSACVPASAIQSTALEPAVDPLRTNHPKAPVGLDERTDFDVRELETTVSQGRQGFGRSLEKIGAELLVSQNLPDDQLYGSLRHVPTSEASHSFSEPPGWQRSRHSERASHSHRQSNAPAHLGFVRKRPEFVAVAPGGPRGSVRMHAACALTRM